MPAASIIPRSALTRLVARGLAVFAALSLLAMGTMSSPSSASAGSRLAIGVPTVVDPIRGAGEPYIAIDARGDPWVTGPGGSTVLTSYYWKSDDGGQTYGMMGPSGGHWLCPTGGSDSSVVIDRLNGDVYLTDQQSLAQLATAKLTGGAGYPRTGCFSAPAMTADRPFQALIHPTGKIQAPQYVANGRRPLIYMSWLCSACLGGGSSPQGGLAFAWSADGVYWHAADPGVPADTLVTDQFFEAPVSSFQWHGPMVADQRTGYVFTAVSCNGGSCPNGKQDNEFGVLIGKPGPGRTDPSNIGQFQSITYQTAADTYDGTHPIPEQGSLFPIVTMDTAGTLYVAWIQGDTADTSAKPPASSWHLYYAYSKDQPEHEHWSKPIRVDAGPQTATSAFGWMAAGDPGRLAFLWLGSSVRENPSKLNPNKQWWPFVALTTDGASTRPHFQQVRVGRNPNHIGDICLNGIACSATVPPGNRNMADFISIDIGPDGAAQLTWASDANQISTLPTSLVPGVPVTMAARQIAGPKLIGSGFLNSSRFATAPTTRGKVDPIGDGYDQVSGTSPPQLDLRGANVIRRGGNLEVHIPVRSLKHLVSPEATHDLWWMVTWQYRHKIYFAKADSDLGLPPEFTAGEPASYDRPGLAPYTIPQLVDYRGGTEVAGRQVGNEWVITVPAGLVGSPAPGAMLESVTGFTLLANDLPPFATIGPGNVPTVVDEAPAFNAQL
ncbi:MAG TPA: hypothetical protein VKA30_01935 [Actinomycetota bacterium]|nr:hypothetical protein [Actinomycetota bacterium]